MEGVLSIAVKGGNSVGTSRGPLSADHDPTSCSDHSSPGDLCVAREDLGDQPMARRAGHRGEGLWQGRGGEGRGWLGVRGEVEHG